MSDELRRRLSRRQILRGAAVVLGTIPGAALLAACGAPPPPPAPAAAPTTKPADPAKPAAPAATSAPAAAAPAASTGQRVVIRDHDWIQGTPGPAGRLVRRLHRQVRGSEPGHQGRARVVPARRDARQAAGAGRHRPDRRHRPHQRRAAGLRAAAQGGRARPRLAAGQNDTEWTGKDQKQFWPGNIRTYTRDGKLWGLPVVGHPGAVQYYINTTMVEKAGLKMPPADGNWSLRRLR